MPHPLKLLQECAELLHEKYNPTIHEYIIEKSLLGARIYPDIQILKNGELRCVVEIGYTRASKVARYREIKVPEIRWYSKSLELVLCERLTKKGKEAVYKSPLDLVSAAIERQEVLRKRALRKKLGEPPFGFADGGDCDMCRQLIENGEGEDLEGGPENCSMFTYFDYEGYARIFECGNDSYHDYTEEHTWDDPMGDLYMEQEDWFVRFEKQRRSIERYCERHGHKLPEDW